LLSLLSQCSCLIIDFSIFLVIFLELATQSKNSRVHSADMKGMFCYILKYDISIVLTIMSDIHKIPPSKFSTLTYTVYSENGKVLAVQLDEFWHMYTSTQSSDPCIEHFQHAIRVLFDSFHLVPYQLRDIIHFDS
jgi:hypothetical protein